jgi:hypothetical protein
MNFRKSLLSCFAVLVLTFTGTRAETPVLHTHAADTKKTAATIRYAEEIKIVLTPGVDVPSNPGYEWQITSNDSRILRLASSPKPAPSEKPAAAASAGIPWAATFLALRPGRSIVRFAYVRTTNSREETPLDEREIIVNVR